MDIDNMKVGELKELAKMAAAMFGGEAAEANPWESLVGRNVVVRANKAGVYWGRIVRTCPGGVVLAPGSRQAWYWTQAGACDGLSVSGPGMEGKYTPPHPHERVLEAGAQIVCVIPTTEAADKAWAEVPEWTER